MVLTLLPLAMVDDPNDGMRVVRIKLVDWLIGLGVVIGERKRILVDQKPLAFAGFDCVVPSLIHEVVRRMLIDDLLIAETEVRRDVRLFLAEEVFAAADVPFSPWNAVHLGEVLCEVKGCVEVFFDLPDVDDDGPSQVGPNCPDDSVGDVG